MAHSPLQSRDEGGGRVTPENPYAICGNCGRGLLPIDCEWSNYPDRDGDCRAHIGWEKGIAEGRALERAQIVAWLRSNPVTPGGFSPDEASEFADGIEDGEHVKELPAQDADANQNAGKGGAA